MAFVKIETCVWISSKWTRVENSKQKYGFHSVRFIKFLRQALFAYYFRSKTSPYCQQQLLLERFDKRNYQMALNKRVSVFLKFWSVCCTVHLFLKTCHKAQSSSKLHPCLCACMRNSFASDYLYWFRIIYTKYGWKSSAIGPQQRKPMFHRKEPLIWVAISAVSDALHSFLSRLHSNQVQFRACSRPCAFSINSSLSGCNKSWARQENAHTLPHIVYVSFRDNFHVIKKSPKTNLTRH